MKPSNVVTRPVLRYYGGKWKMSTFILSNFPPHRIYVEPFGGAMSILLRKPRSYAEVYSDLDDEIVNVFRQARDNNQELQRALFFTPFSRTEFNLAYRPTDDPIERARRTIIRSFQGFGSDGATGQYNTGFRANSNRSGTTPARDWRNYAECFDFLVDRLRGVVIENRDAFEVMAQHDREDTLHYIDSPYVHSTRDCRHGYRHEMSSMQHMRLLAFLRDLKGMVVISAYPHRMYDKFLKGWRRIDRRALADGARERTECLWMNQAARNARALAWMG